jgi:hypothetical protein
LIDELIEHISGDSKVYVWLWLNSTRMCETSTGCRSAGVHAACGAAHGDAFIGTRQHHVNFTALNIACIYDTPILI